MKISKEFILESYFPVPVLMNFFGNPNLFFSSTAHISVNKNIEQDHYEISILPYTEEVKNISYYGTLEGTSSDFNKVEYTLKSINFGEQFEMNMAIEISRIEHSSRIKIAWDASSQSELWQVVTKSTASLNPEHMVAKHIEPFLRALESLSKKMNLEERYMFEMEQKEPMESIPYLTDKMEEISGFIAKGISQDAEFYADVKDKKFRKITFKKGTNTQEGGEAIMAILNERSPFRIKLYFPEYGEAKIKR